MDAVEYRDIPGHPGYRAGSDGSIWSSWGKGKKGMTSEWKRLKPRANRQGHLLIKFRNDNLRPRLVHRFVLLAFVGSCPEGMECCHYDGNPANNKLENLRWDTDKANAEDRQRHLRLQGILPKRFMNKKPTRPSHPRRLTPELVRQIRADFATGAFSHYRLAKKYGIPRSTLGDCVNNKSWKQVV